MAQFKNGLMCELVTRVLVRFLLKQKITVLVHKNGLVGRWLRTACIRIQTQFSPTPKRVKHPQGRSIFLNNEVRTLGLPLDFTTLVSTQPINLYFRNQLVDIT